MIRKRLTPILIIALACSLEACAFRASQRHAGVIASTSVYETLAALQDGEMVLFQAGQIPLDAHKDFNAQLVKALKAGKALNATVRAWPVGQPAPPELALVAQAVNEFAIELLKALPESPAQISLLDKVVTIKKTIQEFVTILAERKA